jgi:hypothetical protein
MNPFLFLNGLQPSRVKREQLLFLRQLPGLTRHVVTGAHCRTLLEAGGDVRIIKDGCFASTRRVIFGGQGAAAGGPCAIVPGFCRVAGRLFGEANQQSSYTQGVAAFPGKSGLWKKQKRAGF